MELECGECLGPESVPSPAPLYRHNFDQEVSDPKPTTNYYFTYQDALTCTSSPLTRSPSPAPKRRRHSYSVPSHPQRDASPLSAFHPLKVLTSRDIAHAICQPDHLSSTEVTAEMREEVVAWCADMTNVLALPEAIVAIAVNLFDRFLMRRPVKKLVLYPLTAACFLLACKVTMDEDIPIDEIVIRSRVSMEDMRVMEGVILNVLEWRVNVVTAHEVVADLNAMSPLPGGVERRQALQHNLLLHALLEYRFAWMRATSIGLACFLVSNAFSTGANNADHTADPMYRVAAECGVELSEVELCIPYLHACMNQLFDDIEEVNSEDGE